MIEAFLDKQVRIDLILRIIPFLLALYIAIRQFLYQNINKKARIYITLFYISFALMQLLTIFYYIEWYEVAKFYIPIYVPVILLLAPLFYLYVKKISRQKIYNLKDYIHFLPAISLFIILSTLLGTYNYLDETHPFKEPIYASFYYVTIGSTVVLFLVQNIFYIFSILRTYKKHKKKIQNVFSYKSGVSLKWVKLFILGYILFVAIISLSEVLSITLYNLSVEIIVTIYLLFSSYYSLKQKEVYANKPISSTDIELKKITLNTTEDKNNNSKENKYEGSALKNEEKINEIKTQLIELLTREKSYLNPTLSIYDIAHSLDINYKYLSQVINQEMKMSFINFINQYRIEASLQLLTSKENEQFTIEAISEMAGFNSKSAFNTSFKKHMGETPSQYRKRNNS